MNDKDNKNNSSVQHSAYPPQINGKPVRDSQMELLRIVAMSMILIHHFVVHGSPYRFYEAGLGMQNAFIYYGVNLFILISGFYGIKVRWRSFLSLLVTVMFFVVIDVVGDCIANWINTRHIDFYDLLALRNEIYRPFTRWWFISCYVMLYMVAPLLNLGLRSATRQQLRGIVAIVFVYNVYAALVGDYASAEGRMLPQFIMLYIIGYWIKVDIPFERLSVTWLIFIAIGCGVVNGMGWQYVLGLNTGVIYSIHYANLLCLVGSVAIFLIFIRFSFRSRIINSVAGASLGCYLLQDGIAGYEHIYKFQNDFLANNTFSDSLMMYVASFVGLWVASWALTWFKNLWSSKLVEAIINIIPTRFRQNLW